MSRDGPSPPYVGGSAKRRRPAECAKTAKRHGASWTVMPGDPRNLGVASWVMGAGTRPFLSLRGPFANDEHQRSMPARCTSRQIVLRGGRMMEPSLPPLDPESGAALVVRVIDDIDESDEEQRNALLSDLLCAAWGSIRAQNQ
jgi:hypothetical protein